jgi:isoleucyl-tRNA synthetase
MTEKPDYRSTVFLPKTDFPMKAGLPQKEPGILARWQADGLYQQLRAARAGAQKFILHDGPPYANGDIHVGHALNHILKDMVVRTQSLLGCDAPYVPGWDCHGLPIEWKVEEQYRKKKLNKDEVPAAEFRAECRAYAQGWVDRQREQLKRLGINGDWDHPYLTMDFAAEGTIVAELMKFAESGQLYRGAKPVMWSPVEKTALAEAEVEYEDITSTQIDVAFEIVEAPNCPELVGAHAVIWTTTPWTIPVNQAIAYGAEIEYWLVIADIYDEDADPSAVFERPDWAGRSFLVARGLLPQFQSRLQQTLANLAGSATRLVAVELAQMNSGDAVQGIDVIDERTVTGNFLPRQFGSDLKTTVYRGSDLAGAIARHPMAKCFAAPLPLAGGAGGGHLPDDDSFVGHAHPNPSRMREGLYAASPLAEFYLRPRPFLDGSDFVTTDSGTGLVHMAPDHGEDDFLLCKANGIEPVFAVEGDGKYRADWPWLGGEGSVINAKFNASDGPICTALREAGGLLAASADYRHSYPHSWRSKAKVIYRCTPQWFVPMDRPVQLPHAKTTAEKGWENEGGAPLHDHATLRQLAVQAIADTRFIPEKGRNRIGSMVDGRPDWVLSRQRAWGVPITLFVKKGTNAYLDDPAVNARIVDAIRDSGVDAWCDERAAEYLGSSYDIDDYERVTDILDVWFDSGSTHAFVLRSGRWPDLLRPAGYTGPPADLYLEGSDQHRGWFQSSLLESCATRGAAPYKAVLTHGFTMDAKGMKMSKSLGNTIDPLKVMETNGADVIRLWALSVDYTEDHRIGDEILKGVADQYRKLRNSFRYLLGALDGFSEAERVDVAAMPELERYVLALLARLDGVLRAAVADYDFNTYVRALTDFCNEDLSAFFFDIRKDSLYCDAASEPKRMAYRSVLDVLFHALVRYAAPVLVFTAEEVWGTRYPDTGSVHLLEWPELAIAAVPHDGSEMLAKWSRLRELRSLVTENVEPMRREKKLGSSLEARVSVRAGDLFGRDSAKSVDFAEICISSDLTVEDTLSALDQVMVERTQHHKCGRCWRHLPEVSEDGALCQRCEDVVNG